MIANPDFEIKEQLYGSKNTNVFRALRVSDGCQLILKTPSDDYPSAEMLSRFRHEYEIIKSLADVKSVIDVYELIPNQNTLILAEEDCGSQPLIYYIQKQSLDLIELGK